MKIPEEGAGLNNDWIWLNVIQFSRFAGNKRVVEVHRELKSELKSARLVSRLEYCRRKLIK